MQRTQVTLVSDLSGEEAVRTQPFSLDGVSYEVDLSAQEIEDLNEALAPYMTAGRRIRGARRSPTSTASAASSSEGGDLKAIRAWAEANGIRVASKGRISGEVRRQYEDAQRG